MSKPAVLVLCTGNSCRSQMAEGLLRAAAGGALEVFSAGVKPAGRVHPGALATMAEIGIDLSGHRSKHVDEFADRPLRAVIAVCGKADALCPVFPASVTRHRWEFRDPAHHEGSEEEVRAEFRAVREEMRRIFEAYAAGWRDAAQA